MLDLVFRRPASTGQPVELVFGGDVGTPSTDVSLLVDVELPGLELEIFAAETATASMEIDLGGLEIELAGVYDSRTDRPMVGHTASAWQVGQRRQASMGEDWNTSLRMPAYVESGWSTALPVRTEVELQIQDGARLQVERASGWEVADRLHAGPYRIRSQDTLRNVRPLIGSGWQTGVPKRAGLVIRTKDGLRDRRASLDSAWQTGMAHHVHVQHHMGKGQPLQAGFESGHQIAMRPPIGQYKPTVPPLENPCYVPPPGRQVDLVFKTPWSAGTELVFVCECTGPGPDPEPEAEIVIPVRRYYVVANEVVLRRVDGNIELLAYAFTLSIDADSWTWSWSATLRRDALPYLEPDSTGPVELEAVINGVPYRLMVEKIGRDSQFGSVRIRVSGRGLAAVLAAPHAPTLNFGNTAPRTGQQLMADVLTINGVSIGWEVDWGLVDWSVPAGAWAMQGSYIDAIADIAGAVGGYVQPHATAKTLRILPRYPYVPWEWDVIAPHVELPAAAASVESVEWVDMPPYNGVFVGGISKGVHGPFKRTGTAGDVLAPAVNHALITHANAHRQRGIAEISNAGRQAHYEIKTQVHPSTGLILPGHFVRYVSDTTVTGIVRSTRLDWSHPVMRQTIGVETHVIA